MILMKREFTSADVDALDQSVKRLCLHTELVERIQQSPNDNNHNELRHLVRQEVAKVLREHTLAFTQMQRDIDNLRDLILFQSPSVSNVVT